MHASHELTGPPADRPSHGSRRRKIVAMSLALLTMVLATFALVSTRSPEAQAQDFPIEALLTGTCDTDTTKAVFTVTMDNPRDTAFNMYYSLTPIPDPSSTPYGGDGEVSLAAGETFTHTFDVVTHAAQPNWRVYFLDADLDYQPVYQSNVLSNPCLVTTPDPPVVTYDVTCQKDTAGVAQSVVYTATVKNPNSVAITYALVRSWDDDQADNTKTVTVGPGATASGALVDYSSTAALTASWTHTLTIKVDNVTVGNPISKQNPCASTPTPVDPEVTYDVTCQKNSADEPDSVLYAPTIKNPNTTAVTYTLVRSWDDDREDETKDVTVAAGETASGATVNFSSADGLAAEWTHTLTIKVGDTVVGEPITKQNPCYTAPPEETSTTTDPTSTTNVASTTSSNNGGLAATGIAVLAILGAGAVLVANGAGLMRLVRKGGEHE